MRFVNAVWGNWGRFTLIFLRIFQKYHILQNPLSQDQPNSEIAQPVYYYF